VVGSYGTTLRIGALSGRSGGPSGGPATGVSIGWYEEDVSDDGPAVFRRFHEAWSRGDLETVLACVDADVVARPLHGALFTRMEFRGRDGIVDWYREMTDPWDRFEAVVEDARQMPTTVKGVLRVVGYRGEEDFHARVGVVCEMREGRIVSLTARNVGDVEEEIAAGT
jgi:ketosteroid isomerase-like protein